MFKKQNSEYVTSSTVVFSRRPYSKGDLEQAIRERMKVNRCLHIRTTNYTYKGSRGVTPLWSCQAYRWLMELSMKYMPWQTRTLTQSDGEFHFDWIEVDANLYKYGWISIPYSFKFRRIKSWQNKA